MVGKSMPINDPTLSGSELSDIPESRSTNLSSSGHGNSHSLLTDDEDDLLAEMLSGFEMSFEEEEEEDEDEEDEDEEGLEDIVWDGDSIAVDEDGGEGVAEMCRLMPDLGLVNRMVRDVLTNHAILLQRQKQEKARLKEQGLSRRSRKRKRNMAIPSVSQDVISANKGSEDKSTEDKIAEPPAP